MFRFFLSVLWFGLISTYFAPMAAGADIAGGQQRYNTICAACHGLDPRIASPARVANDPAGLLNAMNIQPQMNFLNSVLSETDRIDITAYIGSVVVPNSEPQTGWYWNANESGRGFFIEKRVNAIFMAGFHYETNGRATWFVGQGTASSTGFSSPMFMFNNGQTLLGPYRSPSNLPSPGNLSLDFATAISLNLTWPPGNNALTRFNFSGNPTLIAPAQAGSPQSGWWWNASEGGRGFAIEIQGSTLFMCAFLYDDAGNPVWYTSAGNMTTSTRFTGQWQQFANGQAMGAAYQAPILFNSNVGSVELEFSNASNGTLTLPDGRRIAITRFLF